LDLFNLAGNQNRTSKPKAKTKANAEFEKAQLIGLRTEADVYFNFDLFNLAGNQDRTSKPKAHAEFKKNF